MAKRKSKSMMDLASKMPDVDLDAVDGEVSKIHNYPDAQPAPQGEPERRVHPLPPKSTRQTEKNVRVSVDTPASLHKLIRRIILDQDQKSDLRSFYLEAVKERCERLGYSVDE